MDLVQVGQRAEPLGEIAEPGDRRDIPVHRIDRFERDQLRSIRLGLGEKPFKVFGIVVLEDPLLGARLADPLDHGRVVQSVGKYNAAR